MLDKKLNFDELKKSGKNNFTLIEIILHTICS